MDPKEQLVLLTNVRTLLEASQSRGTWRAAEMLDVGTIYTKLSDHVKQLNEIVNPADSTSNNEETTQLPTENVTSEVKEV